MAEVAPRGGGGGANRSFLVIIAGLAALLFVGLLGLGALFIVPSLLGGKQAPLGAAITPTRVAIIATATHSPPTATATLVNPTSTDTPVPAPVLPTPKTGERMTVLVLSPDSSTTLTTQQGGKSPSIQKGTWQVNDGKALVALTDKDGKPQKDDMTFQLSGDQLTAIAFDKALHNAALKLKRVILAAQNVSNQNSAVAALAGTYVLTETVAQAPALAQAGTPIPITATPSATDGSLPTSGLGEDLLMLGAGVFMLLVVFVAHRARAA